VHRFLPTDTFEADPSITGTSGIPAHNQQLVNHLPILNSLYLPEHFRLRNPRVMQEEITTETATGPAFQFRGEYYG